MAKKPRLRMGRIGYLNVLPIYHPLEAGIIPHEYEIVSGPPAVLNGMMSRGELQVSSCSAFEYACHPKKYYLIDDLSIGSRGPVMSVLLLSRRPVEELAGETIFISAETATSVALLKLLMLERYKIDVRYETAPISAVLATGGRPEAFLAIGDEALRLRAHPEYPCRLDLAEAWRDWIGLPFIFGLWVVSRSAADNGLFSSDPGELMRRARDWGFEHMDVILDLTAHGCPLSRQELITYYRDGLLFTLGEEEKHALSLFYAKLAEHHMIPAPPELQFF